jgi:hypothetical protein
LVLVVGASAAVEGDGTDLWQDPGSVRFKFSHDGDGAVADTYDRGLYVNDYPGPYGATLRVYGHGDKNAAFPYRTFDGPFNLKSPEAPKKDFVVFNPAFLDHYAFDLYNHIKADADANEKVHLRMWYVPNYEEPAGATWPEVDDGTSSATWCSSTRTCCWTTSATTRPTAGRRRRSWSSPWRGRSGPPTGARTTLRLLRMPTRWVLTATTSTATARTRS